MKKPFNLFTLLLAIPSAIHALQPASTKQSRQQTTSRRNAFQSILTGAASLAFAGNSANALDMDAFMKTEIESDTTNCNPKFDPKCIPKLNEDEALCKYGQSGNARGEACKRIKAAGGKLPSAGSQQGKSLGGAYAM